MVYSFLRILYLGVGALKFLQDLPSVQVSYVGWNVDYNCTTDDPSATVSLLYSRNLAFLIVCYRSQQTNFF